MSDLVGNPEDRFSSFATHMEIYVLSDLLLFQEVELYV